MDQICNGAAPGSQFLELMAVRDSATHLKQFVVLQRSLKIRFKSFSPCSPNALKVILLHYKDISHVCLCCLLKTGYFYRLEEMNKTKNRT